ncbi:hypothetical protein BH11MYX4_BH11MYX4_54790 [soil metagenome]
MEKATITYSSAVFFGPEAPQKSESGPRGGAAE